MLLFDLGQIGNKLLSIRKKEGLTQSEMAEISGLSDRTYSDIERGVVNMRLETMLRICKTLCITPNDILTDDNDEPLQSLTVLERLNRCSQRERETAMELLQVYLESIGK